MAASLGSGCTQISFVRFRNAAHRFLLLLALVSLARLCVGKFIRPEPYGSISGTVTDSSGAVVVKASVTAKNLETGIAQTVTTDAKGFYSFPALVVGPLRSSRNLKPGIPS